MKAVDMLLKSILPGDTYKEVGELDAKNVGMIMSRVAAEHPDEYARVAKELGDIGRMAAWRQGESIRLADLKPVFDKKKVLDEMDDEVEQARQRAGDDHDAFIEERAAIHRKYADLLQKKTMEGARTNKNSIYYAVLSGARGKPLQMRNMIGASGVYTDAMGNQVPVFGRRSFAEGIRPVEMLAGTYGARSAVISTKSSTARGGDLLKIMVQAAAPLVVTDEDCGTQAGIDLDVNDESIDGRVLAMPAAGLPAGTILDETALAQLKRKDTQAVVVRSAMTCEQKQGLCSRCAGRRSDGRFPRVGDSIGIQAAQAIGEPITQAALNVKHVAGQRSGDAADYSGFNWISQFMQSPEQFNERAALAEDDGVVESVSEAPQGGNYVSVSGKEYYVGPGFDVLVKVGDKVEAGDQLGDGLVDAADVVRTRGLGEGRRYYAERLKQLLDDSGMTADRRNTEILARANINHVVVNDIDGIGDYLPDDVAEYNRVLAAWDPPKDTRMMRPGDARGRFLQAPVLHYSVGTRVTPRMAQKLSDLGYPQIPVSETEPTFSPRMIRLRTASHHNPDWIASQHTSYLSKQLQEGAVRGHDTDVGSNIHFAPRLAVGEDFGKNVRETGEF